MLTTVYDKDHSGRVDSTVELDAVECDVWRALNRAITHRWPSGLAVTYFGDEESWLGGYIGFAYSHRNQTLTRLHACEAEVTE